MEYAFGYNLGLFYLIWIENGRCVNSTFRYLFMQPDLAHPKQRQVD